MDLYEAMRSAPTSRRFTASRSRARCSCAHSTARASRPAAATARAGAWSSWRMPSTRRALRDLYLPHWRAYLEHTGGARMLAEPDGFDAARVRMVRRADEYAERLDAGTAASRRRRAARRPCGRPTPELPRQSIVGGASVYPFVQNLLLGLRAEGLGAALTTLLVPAEAEVKRLLAIPEEVALAAHVGVGYRADPWPARLARRPVEEFAFAERFGTPLV